jgi:hypothetical protein
MLPWLFCFAASQATYLVGQSDRWASLEYDNVDIRRSLFDGQTANHEGTMDGGAIWVNAMNISVSDCHFRSCTAGLRGGGLSIVDGVEVMIVRCCGYQCTAKEEGTFCHRQKVDAADALGRWPNTWFSFCQVIACQTGANCQGALFQEGSISLWSQYTNVTGCSSGSTSAFHILSTSTNCEIVYSTFSGCGGTTVFLCNQIVPAFQAVDFFANTPTQKVLDFSYTGTDSRRDMSLTNCRFYSNTGTDLTIAQGPCLMVDCFFNTGRTLSLASITGSPIWTDASAAVGNVVCASWIFLPSNIIAQTEPMAPAPIFTPSPPFSPSQSTFPPSAHLSLSDSLPPTIAIKPSSELPTSLTPVASQDFQNTVIRESRSFAASGPPFTASRPIAETIGFNSDDFSESDSLYLTFALRPSTYFGYSNDLPKSFSFKSSLAFLDSILYSQSSPLLNSGRFPSTSAFAVSRPGAPSIDFFDSRSLKLSDALKDSLTLLLTQALITSRGFTRSVLSRSDSYAASIAHQKTTQFSFSSLFRASSGFDVSVMAKSDRPPDSDSLFASPFFGLTGEFSMTIPMTVSYLLTESSVLLISTHFSRTKSPDIYSPTRTFNSSDDFNISASPTASRAIDVSNAVPRTLDFALSSLLPASVVAALSSLFSASSDLPLSSAIGRSFVIQDSDLLAASRRLLATVGFSLSSLLSPSVIATFSSLLPASSDFPISAPIATSFIPKDSGVLKASNPMSGSSSGIETGPLGESDKHDISRGLFVSEEFLSNGFPFSKVLIASEQFSGSSEWHNSSPIGPSPLITDSPSIDPALGRKASSSFPNSAGHFQSLRFPPSSRFPESSTFSFSADFAQTFRSDLVGGRAGGQPTRGSDSLIIGVGSFIGILFLIGLIVIAFLVYRRRQQKSQEEGAETSSVTDEHSLDSNEFDSDPAFISEYGFSDASGAEGDSQEDVFDESGDRSGDEDGLEYGRTGGDDGGASASDHSGPGEGNQSGDHMIESSDGDVADDDEDEPEDPAGE